ncbi:hypothetical protein BX616_011090 [Lobosporangium transversale]|uniref:Uncharacterized protein n=1 Tax=Lobosporangium transversale TaxID=64571 RepID=A0A1Y2GST4_9FUNG|nr:hypothetical protein BCR41DRAFT_420773 [Lobosporangium transversale]KAF9909672.1 hypothetical protein BX616_011090 [Lobosporangium transversale]ORZ21852.1 hypothetical protein BCR41DRAFT_420773 [Lobosporangium transversale]|eukprot:XP_021883103.1 hypothetical protein BCR41DRAFT_420773 [Lobosporangium transversale]
MTSSKESLNEKELPYTDAETEYKSISDDNSYSKERSNNHAIDDYAVNDHESFQDYEYDSPQKPIRKPFYRRKKVIVCCTVGTVIFLAVFIPLLLFVILPKIAQSLLNSSSMEIKQLNMTNPGETSLTVSVAAQVGGIPKIFSAEMEFTEQVLVHWQGKVIGSMSLDPVHVKGGKGDILQATGFSIEDKDAFEAFVKDMMASDGFAWTLTSKATLKTLGRSIKDLEVNKVLNMNGLSSFSNIKILKFDLPSDAPEGALIAISASIANPSPIGMTLGTITLDMNFKSAYLGRVVAKNVTLIGGQPMILNLEGTLLRQTDPVHLEELSLLMSNYLGGIVTPATAQGVSVFPDGVNEVTWLTSAILATKMTVPLVAPEPLNVIQGLNIEDMGLFVRPENPWAPTANSNSVSAVFKLPFNISLNITELANATMTLIYKGTPLADLTAAVWNQTSSDMKNNKIVFTLPPSPLAVKDDAHEAFQAFLVDVVQNTDTGFDIKGSADSVASTPLGVVRLKVPFASTVALKGIGFATIPPTISNVTVISGSTEYVTLLANVGIDNPSIFTVDAGQVNLKISGTAGGLSGLMGDVIISNLKFGPGLNNLISEVRFHPSDPAFRDMFFSHFVAGATFDCVITGDAQSTAITSMTPVMEVLSMKTKVPGIIPAPRLIVSGNGAPSLGSVLGNRQIPLTVSVLNPLLTSLSLNDIKAQVFWRENFFGAIASKDSFSIPVGGTLPSPSLILQAPTDFAFGIFMVTTFLPANLGVLSGAIVNVDMTSNIGVTVGGPASVGYSSTISYNQTAVPAFLKLDWSFGSNLRRRAEEIGTSLPSAEPSVENQLEYLQWLKDALFAAYPEEAKRYMEELNK